MILVTGPVKEATCFFKNTFIFSGVLTSMPCSAYHYVTEKKCVFKRQQHYYQATAQH